MQQRAPYGCWPSPITAALITSGLTGLTALSSNGAALFWLESRPTESGRTTLMAWDGDAPRELTPAPFDVRSRVHEYGGGAYLATTRHAYVVDCAEQNLHAVNFETGAVRQITEGDARERFADLAFDASRNRIICITERHDGRDVVNALVAIALDTGSRTVLHDGHDFYASPRLSADGRRLCFVSWDHPNMPWDGTQLHLCELDADGAITGTTIVAGGADESIVQPEHVGDRLVFASDRSGWWNLYVYDAGGIHCIHADLAEYALPPWQFDLRAFTALAGASGAADHLACQRIDAGSAELVLLGIDDGLRSPLPSAWQRFGFLTAHAGRLFFIGQRPDRTSAIVDYDIATRQERVVVAAGELPVSAAFISMPESIAFPTRDGTTAHAYYYPPHHPQYTGPEQARPPLLVTTHGGPTAAASRALNFRIQYYTSRGWAVVDVDYRGSTGYGRAYRDHLKERWGIVDVSDCEDVVAHLARQGRIDPERVAIRGSSAGGYTTLAALTFGECFKAGASLYGVGDLAALAADTHKFESRYLDSLIGPWPERQDRYRERSPIHHTDRLHCPVIFLQGLEDRIVPPAQAEAMVSALSAKKLPVAYLRFPDEQHGFRNAANVRRAIDSEHAFFARVFALDAPGLAPLEIVNL